MTKEHTMNDSITIDGIEYVRATEAPAPPPFQIVVSEGRWNVAGYVYRDPIDGTTIITEARVIRYWGTTAGLGQLAADGPTSTTKLDPYGTVRIPAHAVILTIDADESKW
jgi:hypothetical protein